MIERKGYYYILDGKTPVPVGDIKQWGQWFEKADRTVKKSTVEDMEISTVFLGMEHGEFEGQPLLFETMIFSGEFNEEMIRTTTWEKAERVHDVVVDRLRERQKKIK